MAVAYMTVAIGLLFPVLHDLHLLEKPEGQSLLVLGGIGEISSLAGLTIVSLYYQYGISTKALLNFFRTYSVYRSNIIYHYPFFVLLCGGFQICREDLQPQVQLLKLA